MTEPLQPFDWKNSSYERPGDNWVCGRSCDGSACPLGPTADGMCSVKSICIPEKVGDHYKCTRPSIHGGKCSEGPSAEGECCQSDQRCQPLRSLRRRRQILSVSCFLSAIIICLLVVLPGASQPLLSPGKVTSAHAGIEANCAACHSAAEKDASTADASVPHDGLADSRKCIVCHQDLGTAPLLAHSLDGHTLAGISAATDQHAGGTLPMTLAAFAGPPLRDSHLSCSLCHREHHGRSFDLKQLSDAQCQVCHKNQFDDFAHGHPEFGDFPHERRARIYFDHATHLKVYFQSAEFRRQMPGGMPASDCMTCHEQDQSGAMMLTRGYERSCGSCHDEQIADSAFPGMPFFAITKSFVSDTVPSGQEAGTWPVREDSPREPPPFMSFMLRSALPKGEAPMREVVTIRDVKLLLARLSKEGEAALPELFSERDIRMVESVRTMLPVLRLATASWFPNLDKELEEKTSTEEVAESIDKSSSSRPVANVRGWYFSEIDQTVRYRPVGHADPVLRQLLDEIETRIDGVDPDPDLQEFWRVLSNPSGSENIGGGGPFSTGRCLMCHSVDRDVFGNSKINWRSADHSQTVSFTRFRHQPHTRGDTRESCQTCHQVGEPGQEDLYRTAYFVRDDDYRWSVQPNADCPASSGLDPLDKSRCASCHNNAGVSQSCLQCHNYHVHD